MSNGFTSRLALYGRSMTLAARTAFGPKRPPTRYVTPVSNGTPTMARSTSARVRERLPAARRAGRGHGRAVDAHRVIDTADDQIAGSGPPKGRPDGRDLVEDLLAFHDSGPGGPGRANTVDDM